MQLLKKLPGSRRHPAGWEWWILKRLPLALVGATVVPLAWYLLAHLDPVVTADQSAEKYLIGVRIAAIATAVTAWTAVFTIAIACCIVVLMKGPGYVADQYPLIDAENPRDPASERLETPHPGD